MDICGFISIAELTTPQTISRHLIVISSLTQDKKPQTDSAMVIDEDDKEIVSFAILLHSSLKAENMAAIVHVGNEWFGAVHCWNEAKNDSKKNLMLTLFSPGMIYKY